MSTDLAGVYQLVDLQVSFLREAHHAPLALERANAEVCHSVEKQHALMREPPMALRAVPIHSFVHRFLMRAQSLVIFERGIARGAREETARHVREQMRPETQGALEGLPADLAAVPRGGLTLVAPRTFEPGRRAGELRVGSRGCPNTYVEITLIPHHYWRLHGPLGAIPHAQRVQQHARPRKGHPRRGKAEGGGQQQGTAGDGRGALEH
eukprot:CAMPEP_0170181282 /NCGR_PEP_ID=MMETSP0040_2-20121228/24647_1 /TAXON_ID=641309 /ORGANISM="Lotharella oceanica, Strain CCMP622" /LENGTH=208 /DNA_ID=CAMNT_0010426265 /DNA_START=434 /DNA_END=1058 /DNA_ORIENTATION=+